MKIGGEIMRVTQILPFVILIVGCGEVTEDTSSTDTSPQTTTTTETSSTPTSTEETGETATETGTTTTGTTTTTTGTTGTTTTTTTGTTGTTGTTTTKPSTCTTGGPADLLTQLTAYDPITGAACTTCSKGNINFVLTIENPCPSSISFTTSNTCLVSAYELQYLSTGIAVADAPICGMAMTTWVFPAKSTHTEAPHTYGSLTSGNYNATFYINGTSPIVDPSVAFVVTP
jgi:hypothetical protein